MAPREGVCKEVSGAFAALEMKELPQALLGQAACRLEGIVGCDGGSTVFR